MALGGDQDGPDDKQGFVAWQDPEPGQPAPDGVVTIGVYRTAELKLLNYQDLDEISVSNQLTNSGLKADPREEGSDKPKGTILQQFPAPGTVVKKGDTVTLIVSSGHPPDASTTVFDPTASTVAPVRVLLGRGEELHLGDADVRPLRRRVDGGDLQLDGVGVREVDLHELRSEAVGQLDGALLAPAAQDQ